MTSKEKLAAETVLATLATHFDDVEAFDRFIRAYAGCDFSIPAAGFVEQHIRDRRVYAALRRDCSTESVGHLADVFHQPKRVIAKSFLKSNGIGLKQVRAQAAVADRPSDLVVSTTSLARPDSID